MSSNNTKRNHIAFMECLLKAEELLFKMRVYLDNMKDDAGEQILSEKMFQVPVHPQVIDRIMASPTAVTPSQKVDMAKKFQRAKLAKAQVRNAVVNAATKIDDEDLVLQFMSQNNGGQPYRKVPNANVPPPLPSDASFKGSK